MAPYPDFHTFEDGDIVAVSVHLDDGRVVEEEVDFESIGVENGVGSLHHYLYRPDYAGDLIPIEKIVGLRLVTPRSERTPHDHDPYLDWYAVRALIRFPAPNADNLSYYEERLTLWRAADREDARYFAEDEAAQYLTDTAGECLAMQEPFKLPTRPRDGAEIFSQWCESELNASAYLAQFHSLHGREIEPQKPDSGPSASDEEQKLGE